MNDIQQKIEHLTDGLVSVSAAQHRFEKEVKHLCLEMQQLYSKMFELSTVLKKEREITVCRLLKALLKKLVKST